MLYVFYALLNEVIKRNRDESMEVLVGFHRIVGSASDWRSRCRKLECQFGQITSVDIDHEIICMVIRALPLIQEGQLLEHY